MKTMMMWLLLGCGPREGLTDARRDLSADLPTFPGAEGFGTTTPAGRGGEIWVVDSLAASGPGSLREALEASGPRTVLFSVSGNIWLTDNIEITDPFVTVAGQSAPSPGVTLAGAGIVVRTHDVLLQHLRIRPGDDPDGHDPEDRDALTLADPDVLVRDVVVDHCSLSWATDEVASVWYASEDITFRHNLISEGLSESLHPEGAHSKGLLIGDGARRVSVLGNVFAHNTDRNPVMKGDTSALVVNNLVYDPGFFGIVHYGLRCCRPAIATIEGNVVIPGPSTPEDTPAVWVTRDAHRDTRYFVADSGVKKDDRRQGEWASEREVWVTPLTVQPSESIEGVLLAEAGARPWDRDAVDARVVEQIAGRSGGIIDSQRQVGGWPELDEVSVVLELPSDPSGDEDGDGYTNLEAWLHGLGE